MKTKAINVLGLKKKYGPNQVVKDISFYVEEGEIFGFLGPNGAGKTTTIRMMIGEIPADDGQIEILGYNIPQDIHETKKLVGVVPDYQNVYDRITVRQNLEFFAALNSVPEARIDAVLEEVFLVEHQHKASKDLSRGLKQRSLIARALLHRPKVFFLDEPTSALDPHSAMLIRELIRNLQKGGTTVFLTTHYMEEADSLCDRLAIMNLGEIVACDSPENLKSRFGKRTARVTYTADGLNKTEEYELDNAHKQQQLGEIIKSNHLIKMHTQEATLEEVFMNLTGGKWHSSLED